MRGAPRDGGVHSINHHTSHLLYLIPHITPLRVPTDLPRPPTSLCVLCPRPLPLTDRPTEQDNFPEMMGKVIVINAPSFFMVGWAVCKLVLDARTLTKFEVGATAARVEQPLF